MTLSPEHSRVSRRGRGGHQRARRSPPVRQRPAVSHQSEERTRWPVEDVVRWLVSRPIVDWALVTMLRHPRILMVAGGVIGMILIVWSLTPLFGSTSSSQASATLGASSGVETETSSSNTIADVAQQAQREVLAVITAYNQASITAGIVGNPEHLTPYLAPDGAAWRQAKNEYQHRMGRGETADAALNRWGVLRVEVERDTALVETQEQWDVITSVGDEVISSRRGVLSRNVYRLRRSPSMGWVIVAIDTTPLVA